jgi:hypothetical protein
VGVLCLRTDLLLAGSKACVKLAQRFRMGLAVSLRHLDEPVRDDVARLVDVSGLWVHNVGDRHKNKREIQKLARGIVPQLGAQSRARSPHD